jgi:hypothetical protein
MRFTQVPASETRDLFTKDLVVALTGGVATASIPKETLLRQGTYEIELAVHDGCSMSAVRCQFVVQCSCGPTANAGATQTVWSNNKNGNNRNEAVGPFSLDGSGSYDFDLFHTDSEVLTYEWDFVEWAPSNSLAYATHYEPSCPTRTTTPFPKVYGSSRGTSYYNSAPTERIGTWTKALTGADGTRFVVQPTGGSTVLKKGYQFVKRSIKKDLITIPSTPSDRPKDTTVVNSSAYYWPVFNNNPGQVASGAEENFMEWNWNADTRPSYPDPTTTSSMAWVQETNTTVTTSQSISNTTTVITPVQDPDTVYCQIRIESSSINSPLASLFLDYPSGVNSRTPGRDWNSFEFCRGLWTFQLKVTDRCATVSTDSVMVHVRCNRPPVAVLGAKTVVVFKNQIAGSPGGGFEQVTLDARASSDPDNGGAGYLTYYWSMTSPAAHVCPKTHPPCDQSYCQQVSGGGNFVTSPFIGSGSGTPGRAFGNVTQYTRSGSAALVGVTSFDGACAPTVYPIIYDTNKKLPDGCATPGSSTKPDGVEWCYYDTVPGTDCHVGNSAYFRPTAPGTYTVQLAVYDGCSMSINTVDVVAVCPSVSATISIGATSGFYSGPTTKSVSIKANIFYGDAQRLRAGALTLTWSVTPATGTIMNVNANETTFTPNKAGAYRFTLKIEDGCQTYITPFSQTYTVQCNTPPTTPAMTVSGASGPLVLSTSSYTFPTITVTAASTDAEGDQIDYAWSVLQVNADGSNSPTADVALTTRSSSPSTRNDLIEFQPRPTAPARSYRIIVDATDGCNERISNTQSVTYDCTKGLKAAWSPTGDLVQQYSFAAPVGFRPITFDASSSVIPYKDRANYKWCIAQGSSTFKNTGSCPNSDAAAVQATSGNRNSVQWTPAATVLDSFTVGLIVSDSCSQDYVEATVTTSCQAKPVASLSATVSVVEWNSYTRLTLGGDQVARSGALGGFPAIQLSGSKSTAVNGATSTDYQLTAQNAAGTVSGISQVSPGEFQFLAPAPGDYVFKLSVSNGPCASNNRAEVRVSFICNQIQPTLRQVPTDGRVEGDGSTLNLPTHTWDGVRFPTVYLDGRGLTYKTIGDGVNAGNQPGNLRALRITWLVTQSPAGSSLKFGNNSNDLPAVNTNVVTTGPTANSTVAPFQTVTTTQYTKVSQSITTTRRTTLFNHHYNLPYTCFQPDLPGSYQVQLLVNDGCASVSMNAVVNVACPAATAPSISFLEPAKSEMEMSGSKYQRVHFDARQTAPKGDTDTLTYEWTIVSKPAGSATLVSNAHGNICSIVPDKMGSYTLQLKVSDGCNAPVTQTKTLTVTCTASQITTGDSQVTILSANSAITQTPPAGTIATILWADSGTNNTAGNPFQGQFFANAFQGQYFKITGNSQSTCTVRSRQWYYRGRQCTDPYDLGTPAACTPTTTPAVCTVPEVMGVGTAADKTTALMGLMGKNAACGQCVMACSSAADSTTCALKCTQPTTSGCTQAAAQCTYNLACSWQITSFPCDATTNPAYKAPISGNVLLNTTGQQLTLKKDGRPNQCATDFQCQSPGTYVLQLTVSDGCTTDTKSKTVTCKCETQPLLDLGAASYETMFRCYGADTTPKFADTALDGSKSRIVLTTTGLDLGACPTVSAVPAPRPVAAPPAGSCCPAAPACPTWYGPFCPFLLRMQRALSIGLPTPVTVQPDMPTVPAMPGRQRWPRDGRLG